MDNRKFLEMFKNRPYVNVTILNMCNPALFVIKEALSVHSTNEVRDFIRLENRMNAYFKTFEEEIVDLPCKNTLVAVYFDGNWYRGRVESIFDTTTGPRISIYLLDYGEYVRVEKNYVRELKPEMKIIPYQAVKLKLKDLYPCSLVMQADCTMCNGVTEKWDISAIEFVSSIIKNNNCARMIVEEIDFEGTLHGSLMVLLQEEYVSLNEELVCNKYAQIISEMKSETSIKGSPKSLSEKKEIQYDNLESYVRLKKLKKEQQLKELKRMQDEDLIENKKESESFDSISENSSKSLIAQKRNMDILHNTKKANEIEQDNLKRINQSELCSENREYLVKSKPLCSILTNNEKTVQSFIRENNLKTCSNNSQISLSSKNITETNKMLQSSNSLGKRFLQILQQNSKNSEQYKNLVDNELIKNINSEEETNSGPKKNAHLNTLESNFLSTNNTSNLISTIPPIENNQTKNAIPESFFDNSFQIPDDKCKIQSEYINSENSPEYMKNNEIKVKENKLKSLSPDHSDNSEDKHNLNSSYNVLDNSSLNSNFKNPEIKGVNKNAPISSINIRKFLTRINLEKKMASKNELINKSEENAILDQKSETSEVLNNAEQLDLSSKITCDSYISNQKEKFEEGIIKKTEKINLSAKINSEDHNLKQENETKSKFINNSLIKARSKLTQEKLKNENISNFLYDNEQNANLHNLNNANKNTCTEENSLLSKQISTINSLTKFSNNPQINFHVKTNVSDWEGFIWEKEQFIRSIRHGKGIPRPMRNINAAPFSIPIVEILNELHFPGPSSIQSIMWPAIFRGRNVVSIAPVHSGKTFGYLLPLLSSLSLSSFYERLPTVGGPIALILCLNWKRVQSVHDQCRILLEKCNHIKVLVMYGGGCETLQKLSLVNGCDILIATPPCLLRLLKDKECKITSLQRCCHLIIEDGDIILETFCEEIIEIVKQYALDNKSKAHANILNQVIICSEHWNKAITSFVQCCMHEPLIFITSFYEGAIYARVPTYFHVCLKSEVFTLIPQILNGCTGKKIVICTNNVESAQNIAELVKSLAIYTLIIHSSLFHYEKDSVMREWKNIRGQYTTVVVVITDDVLLDVDISDANCIIQCNLDEISYSQFGRRYSCMLDHFLTLKDIDKVSPCTCHVLVTEDCEAQANKLVNFLNHLQINNGNLSKEWEIPKKLLKMANERKRKLEESQIEFCYYLKAFGHCHQENCKSRHKISQDLDQIMDLPRNGRIKVLITNVIDAIHYYGRIIESTDPDGNSKFSHSYLTLSLKLTEHYSIKENCVSEKNIKVGNIYTTEKQGCTYHRVRILDIVKFNKTGEPKSAKIHFIDEGWHETIDTYKLLKIPSDLAAYPAQIVEIYICNVQPIDKCYDWTTQANTFVHNLIIEKEMVGKLVLCLGYTIWLDPFVHCVKLENNLYLNETKITTALIKDNFAIPNPDHIKKLYSLCDGVIPLSNIIPENETKDKDAKISQVVSHAFLNMDEIHNVYVYAINNPNSFFIQRIDFTNQINNISSECETMIKENELKKLQTFQKGLYCIAPFVDYKWYRACIIDEEICSAEEINVFFVDFGDTNIVKKSDVYIIPSKHLLLPFQAIHCSLADVIPVQNNWIKEAGDIFHELTLEGENKKLFSAKALKQEPSSITKGNYYLIELWCADFNLSEELIKHGFATATNNASFSNVKVNTKELNDDLSEDFKSEELNSSFAFCKLLISRIGKTDENNQKHEISISENLIDSTNEQFNPSKDLKKQDQLIEIQSNSIAKSSEIPKLLNEKLPPETCVYVKYSIPQVTWWQKKQEIIIAVHLFGVNDYYINFKENGISFSAIVNEKHYKFEEELFSFIDTNKSKSVVHGQTVEIRLQKSKVGLKWPRLIAEQQKKTYIKMDYNHLDDSSSEDELPREKVIYNPEDILNVEDSDRSEESENSEEYDDDYLN